MPSALARVLCFILLSSDLSFAQGIPRTSGETLSGKPIVLADAVRGRATLLVAAFSREGGTAAGDWMKAIHADPAFSRVSVFQIAMIAGAPGFIRGIITSGMKRGVSPADQDRFVVLTSDEQPWKDYFGVTVHGDPYIELLDAKGKVLWQGHGAATLLESKLRAALP